MKIVICVLVLTCSMFISYFYKKHFENRLEIVNSLINYVEYYDSSISLFKDNLNEINNKYIIMQNNKNANKIQFSLKNNLLVVENVKYFNESDNQIINGYFMNMGKNEYDFEKEKNKNMLDYLSKLKQRVGEEAKQKGELGSKIIVAVGAIIAIIIWWYDMDVSVLFKIGAIGILTIVISQLFQHQGKGDLATLTSLAGLVLILTIVLSMVSDLFGTIKSLFDL